MSVKSTKKLDNTIDSARKKAERKKKKKKKKKQSGLRKSL
jgi:hypothetical protein